MNKVVVEVYVPIAKEKYDIILPEYILMGDAMNIICKMVSEVTGGMFKTTQDTVICNRFDGSIININLTVKELGLCNGSKLMLV